MTTRTETPAEYVMRKGMDPYEQIDLQAEKIKRLQSEREHYRDKYMQGIVEIERLQKRNALLEDVAVAAGKAEDIYPNMAKICGIPDALDKLREVGDE